MPDFDVQTASYAEVNQQLLAEVRNVGDVLRELNGVLKQIVDAVDSKATPLWIDQQNRWNRDYDDMALKLNKSAAISRDVDGIFIEGDDRGSRIMGS